jgi:hypothetical protein
MCNSVQLTFGAILKCGLAGDSRRRRPALARVRNLTADLDDAT